MNSIKQIILPPYSRNTAINLKKKDKQIDYFYKTYFWSTLKITLIYLCDVLKIYFLIYYKVELTIYFTLPMVLLNMTR